MSESSKKAEYRYLTHYVIPKFRQRINHAKGSTMVFERKKNKEDKEEENTEGRKKEGKRGGKASQPPF